LLTKHAQQHWCASPSIQYSTLYPIKWNGRFRVVTPRINFPEIIKRTRVGSVSSEMRSVERVANLPQQPENSAETKRKTAGASLLCGVGPAFYVALAHRKTFSLLPYTSWGAKLEN